MDERERSRQRRQTEAYKTYHREYGRARYHAKKSEETPEQREARLEYQRQYRERNREALAVKRRDRQKREYRADPEKHKARAQRWKDQNPERVRELQHRYQEANRERINQRSRDWYAANKERASAQNRHRRLARYGLTEEEYRVLLESQAGRCAICGSPEAVRGKPEARFRVDHDHKTGAVRGLLCLNCNSGLGQFGDDPGLLIAAADYLTSLSSGATSTRSSAA